MSLNRHVTAQLVPVEFSARRVGRVVAILIIGAVLLALVLQISLAGVLRQRAPESALRVAPWDAEAKANLAATLVLNQRGRVGRARELSLSAIRRTPVSVVAVRTLGIAADLEGQRAQAVRLLNQAQLLSRRDVPTQLWIIEFYSQSGDVEKTLLHYDVAMRASRSSRDLLIPILVGASRDPELIAPVARLLKRKPSGWWLDFIGELAEQGPVRSAVPISLGLLNANDPRERRYISALLSRLTGAQEYGLAWEFYEDVVTRSRGVRPAPFLRDGEFEARGGLQPFDWSFTEEGGFSAEERERPDGASGSALWLSAFNGRTGDLATQLLRLSPGSYRLELEAGNIPTPILDRPTIRIVCAKPEESEDLLDMRFTRAGTATIRLSSEFRVPPGCPWQWLRIRTSGNGPVVDEVAWLDNLRLRRVGE